MCGLELTNCLGNADRAEYFIRIKKNRVRIPFLQQEGIRTRIKITKLLRLAL